MFLCTRETREKSNCPPLVYHIDVLRTTACVPSQLYVCPLNCTCVLSIVRQLYVCPLNCTCVLSIVRVSPHSQTELFLFMEYCHEGTLWSIAQQGLPEHMIRRYTRDLLRAVDLLHSKGIIHRDIKGQLPRSLHGEKEGIKARASFTGTSRVSSMRWFHIRAHSFRIAWHDSLLKTKTTLPNVHFLSLCLKSSTGANIFLSNDSIKLGDFGLSVQLKNLNKTLPNEIRQQVGTVRKTSAQYTCRGMLISSVCVLV